jgi:hypothetical protein
MNQKQIGPKGWKFRPRCGHRYLRFSVNGIELAGRLARARLMIKRNTQYIVAQGTGRRRCSRASARLSLVPP